LAQGLYYSKVSVKRHLGGGRVRAAVGSGNGLLRWVLRLLLLLVVWTGRVKGGSQGVKNVGGHR